MPQPGSRGSHHTKSKDGPSSLCTDQKGLLEKQREAHLQEESFG